MMRFAIQYSREAEDDLARLGYAIAVRIDRKIRFYAASDQPLRFAKPLVGKHAGRYRFRIGAYRAIFRIEKDSVVNVLWVMHVDNRDSVYE